jgi:membrane protein DedA with SNARE-associated domain
MVGVRSPVYLSAGVLRVGFWRFILMDLFCATAVVGLFFGLSYLYGEQIVHLARDAELWFTLLVIGIVLVVGGYFYNRRRRRLNRYMEIQSRRKERAQVRARRRLTQPQKTVA